MLTGLFLPFCPFQLWNGTILPFLLYHKVFFDSAYVRPCYLQFLFNGLVNPPKYFIPSPEREHAPPELADPEERQHLVEEVLDETAVLPADLGTSGFDVVPEPISKRSASVDARHRSE